MARHGRGRLSSLDLLPAGAEEHVTWALMALRDRKMLQQDILAQLNLRLVTAGVECPPISSSAFSRASMRLNAMASRLDATREIAAVLANKFEDGPDNDLTLLTAETIKMCIFQSLEQLDNPGADVDTSEMLGNLANALKSAEQAKTISAVQRSLIEKNFAKKVDAGLAAVAKSRGLSAETVEAFKAGMLGIRKAE